MMGRETRRNGLRRNEFQREESGGGGEKGEGGERKGEFSVKL